MGMHEGRARLGKSVKELLSRWGQARLHWNDAPSKAFETRFLTPLEMDLRQALGAMDQMAQVLQQIRRDCQ
jgi:hypothetical protein